MGHPEGRYADLSTGTDPKTTAFGHFPAGLVQLMKSLQ
jgi:hypothetical protein